VLRATDFTIVTTNILVIIPHLIPCASAPALALNEDPATQPSNNGRAGSRAGSSTPRSSIVHIIIADEPVIDSIVTRRHHSRRAQRAALTIVCLAHRTSNADRGHENKEEGGAGGMHVGRMADCSKRKKLWDLRMLYRRCSGEERLLENAIGFLRGHHGLFIPIYLLDTLYISHRRD
jgi:hypothetical protein